MISRIMKNLDVIIISSCVVTLSVLGKIFTNTGLDWYRTLNLPHLVPENWVFGAVWTVLYILAACATVILVRAYKHIGYYQTFLGFFLLLAILNPLWSYLFFIEHSISAALLASIVMEFILITIIVYAWNDARIIALLMVPSALWIAFAIYLNYQILLLN
ncbi:MAG: tryptophan-rich sensory protein [Candidatus Babeliaceae bacterium]|nr:tryptophan-rich sensory protein [Candidatus Babeliaceae bacterium]